MLLLKFRSFSSILGDWIRIRLKIADPDPHPCYQGILVGTVTTQDHSISAIVYAGYSSKSKIQQKNNRNVD